MTTLQPSVLGRVWPLLLLVLISPLSRAETSIWPALRSGDAIVLLRHALAPGVGDPDTFNLDDCSTQRNLSKEGLLQARRLGEWFRNHGIDRARVVSSAWCRCLDTARALGLGSVETLPALNSFFGTPWRTADQTQTLIDWLGQVGPGEPLILVTHQVNITALTDVVPRSGELVVIRFNPGGAVEVLDRLLP